MGMTQKEIEIAASTIRANNAIAEHFERIDWEQRRYEIAKENMQAIIKSFCPKKKEAAMMAVEYADALIKELKQKVDEKKDKV